MYKSDNVTSDTSMMKVKEISTKTVTIAKTDWMLENLNVSNYRNGEPIKQAKTKDEWIKCAKKGVGCWCYYDNDDKNGTKYGKLYNWYAVNDSRGLAPKGWHIPSDDEFDELIEALGGKTEAGKKMKSNLDWTKNCNPTNESGFLAIPAGFRSSTGEFLFKDTYALWWSSTNFKDDKAWYYYLFCDLDFAVKYYYSKGDGFSIRCIKD